MQHLGRVLLRRWVDWIWVGAKVVSTRWFVPDLDLGNSIQACSVRGMQVLLFSGTPLD